MDKKNKFDFFKPIKRPSEDDSKCSASSKKSKALIDLENEIRTQLLVPGCAPITKDYANERMKTYSFLESVKVKVDEKEHLVIRCKYCAPLWDRPNNLKQKQIVFGYATEQAFKKRRGTFSEHEQGDTHKAQVERARMKLVLAEGKLPPAETGKIFGFLTPIDPYTDTVLKRRIRTAHKIGNQGKADAYRLLKCFQHHM